MSDDHRIKHIDAWRFIAVSLVIQGHLIVHSNFGFLVENYPFLRRIGRFGTLGVLFFFFISGFVICRGLIVEKTSSSTISLKAFYIRRTLRILPPLWLYLAALIMLSTFFGLGINLSQIGKSALFLCNVDLVGGCSWYAGHTWSLSYEEQFYLIFPLIFLLAKLTVRPSFLIGILMIMVFASLGLRGLGILFWADYFSHMIFMLTGCSAGLYWPRLIIYFRRLTLNSWLFALSILIVCAGLLPYPLVEYVQTALFPPLIGLLVLGTPVAHPRIRAFFENAFVSYLGKISFTVYLWQQLATAPWPNQPVWWTLVFVLGVWLFAHYSYKYFERPLIGVAHQWSDRIKQSALTKHASGV